MSQSQDLFYQFPYQKISISSEVPFAPVVKLILKNPQLSLIEPQKCLGLLDTGSDVTLVPSLIIDKLRLRAFGRSKYSERPTGLGGRTIAYTTHLIQLSFNDDNFLWFEVWNFVENENLVIIGRDVLNDGLNVNFDGKNLMTTIQFTIKL